MRIGLLSFAHLHAESYLSALLPMHDVHVMGIADDNLRRGDHFATQFGVPLYDNLDELLHDSPDALIICSENARHLPLVRRAAEAGAAILCEKPLATTVADAQEIVRGCQSAGVPLMTAFPMRFSPPVQEIDRLVKRGELGRIYGANTTNQGALPQFHQAQNLDFLGRGWFTDPALAGGGALTDHIVHLADLLRWMFACEVTEVYAVSNTVIGGGALPVETGGLVLLTFENGAFASIDCSWSKPAYYTTWGGLKMELVGEKGLATLDAFRQAMTVYRDGLGRPQLAFWGSDPNHALLREFIAAVREGRPPAITGEDGLRAVEIVQAAYESARTGQPVALPRPSG